MALLDTTFLIDLMKEAKRRRAESATVKLDELIGRGEALRIAVFTIGELYVGVAKGTTRHAFSAAWSANWKNAGKRFPTWMR